MSEAATSVQPIGPGRLILPRRGPGLVLLFLLLAGACGGTEDEAPPAPDSPSAAETAPPGVEPEDHDRPDPVPEDRDEPVVPPFNPGVGVLGDAGAGLLDREWEFIEATGLPLDELPSRPHILLESGEGNLAGSTGCNRILGEYRLEEDTLVFSATATTRMMCPDPAAEVESGILEILDRTRGFRMVGGNLELLDADEGVIARLVPLVPPLQEGDTISG